MYHGWGPLLGQEAREVIESASLDFLLLGLTGLGCLLFSPYTIALQILSMSQVVPDERVNMDLVTLSGLNVEVVIIQFNT